MCTVREVYGLQAELQFLDSLKCTNEEMGKTGRGGKYPNINCNENIPMTLE